MNSYLKPIPYIIIGGMSIGAVAIWANFCVTTFTLGSIAMTIYFAPFVIALYIFMVWACKKQIL